MDSNVLSSIQGQNICNKNSKQKLLHKEIKTSEDIRVRHTARRSKHLLFHIIMQHVIFVNNKLTNIHI